MLFWACPDPSRHLAFLSLSRGVIFPVRHLLLFAQAHCTGSGLGYKRALKIPLKVTFSCYRKQILNLSLVSSLSVENPKKLGKRCG